MTNRPRPDVAAVALGLSALGFGIVALFSPLLTSAAVQPVLALILVTAGSIGLIVARRRNRRNPRKET